MNGRANEMGLVEMCERRNVDKNERYRFFWQGDKNERAIGGVGVLMAEKLEISVIEINRVNGRLMVIKVKVGKRIINVLSAYSPQVGLSRELKESFWDDVLSVISDLSETGAVVLACTSMAQGVRSPVHCPTRELQ